MIKLYVWLSKWLDIVDCLVYIITLGYFETVLGVSLRVWLYVNKVQEVERGYNSFVDTQEDSAEHSSDDNRGAIAASRHLSRN